MSSIGTKTSWCLARLVVALLAAATMGTVAGCAQGRNRRTDAVPATSPLPAATEGAQGRSPEPSTSRSTATAAAAAFVEVRGSSEPFMHEVATPSAAPLAPHIVRVAGFAVRLPSGDLIIDVPHSERRAIHVRAPSLDARLKKLAGIASPPLPVGTHSDPHSLAGALDTGSAMEGTRTSSTIVVVEGELAPDHSSQGAASDSASRNYELSNGRITSTVTAGGWIAAYAKYEAGMRTLPRALESTDPVRAELALDGITAPLERLVDGKDARFFEAVRFNRRLVSAMRALQHLASPRGVAAWTAATLPDRSTDGPLLTRPRPSSAEREAYRTLFLFGGVLAHRAYLEVSRSGDRASTCPLLQETIRLLSTFDARLPILGEIKQQAAVHNECQLTL